MIVVVTGPAACGKTRNRDLLKSIFGCRRVVDSWEPKGRGCGESLIPLRDGDLVLTTAGARSIMSDREIARFKVDIHDFAAVKAKFANRDFLPGAS
ncbi:hypothetical protein O4H52_00940 [Sphingomonadaceae bacterium G21617-S1]|nr:hypothetical protein [Sphingomonadaceae bacterium G21617-S1]